MLSPDTNDVSASSRDIHGQPETARLHIVETPSPAALEAHRLFSTSGQILVGRELADGISIPDRRISRAHLRFEWNAQHGTFHYQDVGSRNGTYLNGRQTSNAVLKHGDVLRIGDTLLAYEAKSAMASVETRIKHAAKTKRNVLIQGEPGVGQEQLANRLHQASGELLRLDCAHLDQAELTRVLTTHRGTLVLDDVGTCSAATQRALLHALRAQQRSAAESEPPPGVLFIGTTPCALEPLVESATFHAELHARLAQTRIILPALRERKADLLTLARDLVRSAGVELSYSVDAAEALLAWHWPDNLPELRSVLSAFSASGQQRLDLSYLRAHHAQLTAVFQMRQMTSSGTRRSCSTTDEHQQL